MKDISFLNFVETTFSLAPIGTFHLLSMAKDSNHGESKAKSPERSMTPRNSSRDREEAKIKPNSYFCELCLAGLEGLLPISDQLQSQTYSSIEFKHYQDLDSWRTAVNDGCYFCALFWRHLTLSSSGNSELSAFETGFRGISLSFYWHAYDPIERKREPENRNIGVKFMSGTEFTMTFYLEALQDHERALLANAGTGKSRLLF